MTTPRTASTDDSSATTSATTGTAVTPTTRSGGEVAPTGPLSSDLGKTSIADVVVQKIAGLAAREVPGVHSLGGSTARALGAVRTRIPGSRPSLGQGVSVEVGERQAAVDLMVVVEYGAEIGDLSSAVRSNVIDAVERMTGLEVTEVNISVDDVHVAGDDDDDRESRVQ